MFEHVLVPLDGSPLAESALPAAVTVAHRWGGQITLLHVQEINPPATVHGAPHLQKPDQAERYLAAASERLRREGMRVNTHVHKDEMRVAEGIAEHAVELGADLVILCVHGGHRLRTLLLGAPARQVLARATVPVLIVPPSPAGATGAFPVKGVLVPLDGAPEHEAALTPARAFAEHGALMLVRVVPTAETVPGSAAVATRLMPHAARALLEAEVQEAVRYLESVDARVRAPGREVATFVARGDPMNAILALARGEHIDLIAMATHARSGMAAAWESSLPWRLVEAGKRAVLVVLAREGG